MSHIKYVIRTETVVVYLHYTRSKLSHLILKKLRRLPSSLIRHSSGLLLRQEAAVDQ